VLLSKSCSYVADKGKAIPVKAWAGPGDSSKFRLPDFKTTSTRKWQGCQPYAPAAFTSQEIFLVLFSVTASNRNEYQVYFLGVKMAGA
jgi:hypothetical protein